MTTVDKYQVAVHNMRNAFQLVLETLEDGDTRLALLIAKSAMNDYEAEFEVETRL